MENVDDQNMVLFVTELIDALEQELELENPFIMEDEKNLLVRYMVQDILQRKGYGSWFDSSKVNACVMGKSLKGIDHRNEKIIIH
ncbi:MAG: hypothetical protein AB1847_18255 [bacterium]